MQASYAGPLADYNSLRDEHLAEYFSSPLRKRHLRRMGLITRDGRIVDDATLRMNAARQDHKRRTRELLASSIVDKAVELERKRRAELKGKLELLAKLEHVEKVKSQKSHPPGVQHFNPYYTNKTPPLPRSQLSAMLQTHCNQLGISSITRQQGMKQISGARSITTDYPSPLSSHLPSPKPHPPSTPKPKSAVTVTRRRSTLRKRPTTAPPNGNTEGSMSRRNQAHSGVKITLCFIGKSLRLDGWADSTHSEVMVLQQHCGGNAVQLFKRRVRAKECFTFTSRRHIGMPFGLTLYLDGMIDSRVSTCCEYKHQCGRKLGSKSAHFRMVSVEGGRPCYRCVAEREAQQDPPSGAGLRKGEGLITDLEEPAELEMQFGNTHRVREPRDEVTSPEELEIDLSKHRKLVISSNRTKVASGRAGRGKGRSSSKNGHNSPTNQSQLPDTSSEVPVPSESGLPSMSSGNERKFESSSDTRVPHSQSGSYYSTADEKPQLTSLAFSRSVIANDSAFLLQTTAPSEGEEFDLGAEYSDDAFEEDENASDEGESNAREGNWNPSSTAVGSDKRSDQIPEVQPEINLALSDVNEGNSHTAVQEARQSTPQDGKVEPETAMHPSEQSLQHEPRPNAIARVIHQSATLPSILVTPQRQKSSTMRSTLSVSFNARTLENYATSDQELSEVESNHSYSPPRTPEPGEEPLSATMTLEDAQNMLKSSSAYSLGSLLNEKESEYASTVEVSSSEDEDVPDLERKVSEIHSQVGVQDSNMEPGSETGMRAVSSATRLPPGSSPSRVLQDKTSIADDRIIVTSPVHVQSEEEGEEGESPEPNPEAQTRVTLAEERMTEPEVDKSRDRFLGHDKIVIAEIFETPRSSSELKTATESNGSQMSNSNESGSNMPEVNGERSEYKEKSSNQDIVISDEAVRLSPPLPETEIAESRESLHHPESKSRLQAVAETRNLIASESRDAVATGSEVNATAVMGDSDSSVKPRADDVGSGHGSAGTSSQSSLNSVSANSYSSSHT